MRTLVLFAATALAGLAVWLAIAAVTGMPEPWDSSLFFAVGIPVMVVVSGIAGFVEPKRAWLWGVAVVALQVVALFAVSGVGPLAVVGLMMFGVLAGICIAGALVGALLRQRTSSTEGRTLGLLNGSKKPATKAAFRVRLDSFDADRDLPRLRNWLGRPHVSRWWVDADEAIAVASRHSPTDHALIVVNDDPIGYICWQKPSREELETAGLTDLPPDHVDIDILIGDPECVGKGIGPRALALLLERLRLEGASSVGLAAADDNQRARRAYQKAGFGLFRRFWEDQQYMYYFVRTL